MSDDITKTKSILKKDDDGVNDDDKILYEQLYKDEETNKSALTNEDFVTFLREQCYSFFQNAVKDKINNVEELGVGDVREKFVVDVGVVTDKEKTTTTTMTIMTNNFDAQVAVPLGGSNGERRVADESEKNSTNLHQRQNTTIENDKVISAENVMTKDVEECAKKKKEGEIEWVDSKVFHHVETFNWKDSDALKYAQTTFQNNGCKVHWQRMMKKTQTGRYRCNSLHVGEDGKGSYTCQTQAKVVKFYGDDGSHVKSVVARSKGFDGVQGCLKIPIAFPLQRVQNDANGNPAVGVNQMLDSRISNARGISVPIRSAIKKMPGSKDMKVKEIVGKLAEKFLDEGGETKCGYGMKELSGVSRKLSNHLYYTKTKMLNFAGDPDALREFKQKHHAPKTKKEHEDTKSDEVFFLDVRLEMFTKLESEKLKKINREIDGKKMSAFDEIKNILDGEGFFIVSGKEFAEDMRLSMEAWGQHQTIGFDGVHPRRNDPNNVPFCLVMGAFCNAYVQERSRGHAREFRPCVFGFHDGETSTITSTVFVAIRNYVTKVMELPWTEPKYVTCDGAAAFKVTREIFFPNATFLPCTIHYIRHLEQRFAYKSDVLSQLSKVDQIRLHDQCYILRNSVVEAQFHNYCNLFKRFWENSLNVGSTLLQSVLSLISSWETYPFSTDVGIPGIPCDTNSIESQNRNMRDAINSNMQVNGINSMVEVPRILQNNLIVCGSRSSNGHKAFATASSVPDSHTCDTLKCLQQNIVNTGMALEILKKRCREHVQEDGKIIHVMPNTQKVNSQDPATGKRNVIMITDQVGDNAMQLYVDSLQAVDITEHESFSIGKLPDHDTIAEIGALVHTYKVTYEELDAMKLPEDIVTTLKVYSSEISGVEGDKKRDILNTLKRYVTGQTKTPSSKSVIMCVCIDFKKRCQCGHVALQSYKEEIELIAEQEKQIRRDEIRIQNEHLEKFKSDSAKVGGFSQKPKEPSRGDTRAYNDAWNSSAHWWENLGHGQKNSSDRITRNAPQHSGQTHRRSRNIFDKKNKSAEVGNSTGTVNLLHINRKRKLVANQRSPMKVIGGRLISRGAAGLVNDCGRCYLNASLQALANTKILSIPNNEDGSVISKAFYDLVGQLRDSESRDPLDPSAFHKCILEEDERAVRAGERPRLLFPEDIQHDPGEFIEEVIAKCLGTNADISMIQSKRTCSECSTALTVNEKIIRLPEGGAIDSISTALDQKNNAVSERCDTCDGARQHSDHCYTNVPQCLIFAIPRTKFNEDDKKFVSNYVHLHIPSDIDTQKWMAKDAYSDQSTKYDLDAVVISTKENGGNLTPSSEGHCTTYARTYSDGVWRHYDDHVCTDVPESELEAMYKKINERGCVLIYSRTNVEPEPLVFNEEIVTEADVIQFIKVTMEKSAGCLAKRIMFKEFATKNLKKHPPKIVALEDWKAYLMNNWKRSDEKVQADGDVIITSKPVGEEVLHTSPKSPESIKMDMLPVTAHQNNVAERAGEVNIEAIFDRNDETAVSPKKPRLENVSSRPLLYDKIFGKGLSRSEDSKIERIASLKTEDGWLNNMQIGDGKCTLSEIRMLMPIGSILNREARDHRVGASAMQALIANMNNDLRNTAAYSFHSSFFERLFSSKFYKMQEIGEKSTQDAQDALIEKCYDFEAVSQFTSKHRPNGGKPFKQWMNRLGKFQVLEKYNKLLFSIHLKNYSHWIVIELDLVNMKIACYDSLANCELPANEMSRDLICAVIKKWVVDESVDKNIQATMQRGKYTIKIGTTSDSPQQNNGIDCGVFSLAVIQSLMKQSSPIFCFEQKDIEHIRKRYVLKLFNCEVADMANNAKQYRHDIDNRAETNRRSTRNNDTTVQTEELIKLKNFNSGIARLNRGEMGADEESDIIIELESMKNIFFELLATDNTLIENIVFFDNNWFADDAKFQDVYNFFVRSDIGKCDLWIWFKNITLASEDGVISKLLKDQERERQRQQASINNDDDDEQDEKDRMYEMASLEKTIASFYESRTWCVESKLLQKIWRDILQYDKAIDMQTFNLKPKHNRTDEDDGIRNDFLFILDALQLGICTKIGYGEARIMKSMELDAEASNIRKTLDTGRNRVRNGSADSYFDSLLWQCYARHKKIELPHV